MKIANRVPLKEFLSIIPHPVIIQSFEQRLPVVISDVHDIGEKRTKLGKLLPQLQHI